MTYARDKRHTKRRQDPVKYDQRALELRAERLYGYIAPLGRTKNTRKKLRARAYAAVRAMMRARGRMV